MTRIWSRSLAVLAMLFLATTGCGGAHVEDASDGARTTEPPSVTTTEPPSPNPTMTASSTADVTTAPPTTAIETTTAQPDLGDEPPLRGDAVSGSGCSPGGETLPAGWWYGTIEGPPDGDLGFDLACYYWGAAADAEALSHGDEAWNGYYVVNDNLQIRMITVAGESTASCVQVEPRVENVACAPGEVAGDWAVWIRVTYGGEVDRIVEQYAP